MQLAAIGIETPTFPITLVTRVREMVIRMTVTDLVPYSSNQSFILTSPFSWWLPDSTDGSWTPRPGPRRRPSWPSTSWEPRETISTGAARLKKLPYFVWNLDSITYLLQNIFPSGKIELHGTLCRVSYSLQWYVWSKAHLSNFTYTVPKTWTALCYIHTVT